MSSSLGPQPASRCCAITGANGYVGSCIASYLAARGWNIVELNRRDEAATPGARVAHFELGESPSRETFAGADTLIHCSYDFRVNSWEDIKRVNGDGAARLFAAAAEAGVRNIIVISTISAFEGCRSLYGRAKLLIEQDASRYGALCVRPGLVYDSGEPKGIVGALAGVINRSPIVPLIGSGNQVLYPCHADDLAMLIYTLAERHPAIPGPIVAASRTGMTFREILTQMARARRRQVMFVPVPDPPILALLRAAERLGVRTRLRADSLVSLLNQNPRVDFSGLDATGVVFRGLELQHGTA